jgi:hypothetical protein
VISPDEVFHRRGRACFPQVPRIDRRQDRGRVIAQFAARAYPTKPVATAGPSDLLLGRRRATRAGRPMRTHAQALWSGVTLAGVLAVACSDGPTSPSASSLSVGQWSGTTTQGMPIAFTVSSDEAVTTITVAYSFNSCSGTQTFSNLSVPTAPDVNCIPGPCSGPISTCKVRCRFGTIRCAAQRRACHGRRRGGDLDVVT